MYLVMDHIHLFVCLFVTMKLLILFNIHHLFGVSLNNEISYVCFESRVFIEN